MHELKKATKATKTKTPVSRLKPSSIEASPSQIGVKRPRAPKGTLPKSTKKKLSSSNEDCTVDAAVDHLGLSPLGTDAVNPDPHGVIMQDYDALLSDGHLLPSKEKDTAEATKLSAPKNPLKSKSKEPLTKVLSFPLDVSRFLSH